MIFHQLRLGVEYRERVCIKAPPHTKAAFVSELGLIIGACHDQDSEPISHLKAQCSTSELYCYPVCEV